MQHFSLQYFTAVMHTGGPALWVLLGCNIIIVWVALEKLIRYFQVKGPSPLPLQDLKQGKRLEHCPRIQYRFLLRELQCQELSPARCLASRENFIKQVELELSRGLPTLGTISVIAPFIGLFGTVLGIMHAFGRIAAAGSMSPEIVGAGIAEALITTAAGLWVAVCAVTLYNIFKTLMERQLLQLEIAADALDASGVRDL